MAARHEPAYIEDATLSQCQLVLDEMNENTVEQIRDAVFQATTSSTRPGGSSIENWFKKVSQGNTAYRVTMKNSGLKTRIIAWKKGTNFGAANLYFRTVDTSRLLPSALADFRIQWYAHQSFWDLLDNKAKVDKTKSRVQFQIFCLSSMLFDMLIMRNMLDFDGADIPIIFVDWSTEQLDIALGYWEELSKDNWSRDEQRKRFFEIDSVAIPSGTRPCFFQTDLLVRSLLSDPKVGYVPPFIVFVSKSTTVKARALFMDPDFCPPRDLMATYPTGCDAPECTDVDCALFGHSVCRSLVKDTKLIHKSNFGNITVRCNFWPCGNEQPEHANVFSKCQRCKEVLYCSKLCQTNDWPSHKFVCEHRA